MINDDNTNIMKKVKMGERIKTQRKLLNLTQKELGKKMQISQKQISKYENNESQPPVDQLQKLAEILNVSTDWLICDTIEITRKGKIHGHKDTTNKPPGEEFSKQQLELLEITKNLTEQQQDELLGAVKMFVMTL